MSGVIIETTEGGVYRARFSDKDAQTYKGVIVPGIMRLMVWHNETDPMNPASMAGVALDIPHAVRIGGELFDIGWFVTNGEDIRPGETRVLEKKRDINGKTGLVGVAVTHLASERLVVSLPGKKKWPQGEVCFRVPISGAAK